MRGLRYRLRVLAAGVACVALVCCASACSDTPVTVPPVSSASPASTVPDDGNLPESTPEPIKNDLAKLPLRRSLSAGSLTVNVEYNTQLPVAVWRAAVNKPLHVTLTAVNKKKQGQKIYLSKVTVNVTTYDASGVVDGPRTLSDSTNINPGFIVTFPETYNQSFSLPAVDDSGNQLVIDFTYELVLQASKDKDGRNFSKQVATDTIVVPIAP